MNITKGHWVLFMKSTFLFALEDSTRDGLLSALSVALCY